MDLSKHRVETQFMSSDHTITIPLPNAQETLDRIITEMAMEEVTLKMEMRWIKGAEVPLYTVHL